MDSSLCPTFHPTIEEFSCFAAYIRKVIEPKCKEIGMCKIVPPNEFFTRSYDDLEYIIPTPLIQNVGGKKGIFNVDLVERKSMTLVEFREMATKASIGMTDPATTDLDTLERKFWKGLRSTMDPPTYGADIVGSLFGNDHAMSWNVNNLDTILRSVDLPGITQAMLYFGMWSAMFALHTEDMELYSINYLHTGKPKIWYTIPPQHAGRVERLCEALFPDKYMACHQFLRHKSSMISPNRLHESGIPYSMAVQGPREFIITFPRAYHQGFNTGFNIAESVNFATLGWIPIGMESKLCKCMPDNVTLDMNQFMTQLFPFKNGSNAMELDDWVFSCICGKFTSSIDIKFIIEDKWFECTKCKIWCHLGCIYPDLYSNKEDELPLILLCHRCNQINSTISLKKNNFVKNTIVYIESPSKTIREAKVVYINGEYIRVHYKGEKNIRKEWICLNSSKIISWENPKKKIKKN